MMREESDRIDREAERRRERQRIDDAQWARDMQTAPYPSRPAGGGTWTHRQATQHKCPVPIETRGVSKYDRWKCYCGIECFGLG
jgi:hypothetical protein